MTVEHLNDDYGITGGKVSWLAAQLDTLAPGWAEYVDPSLFEQREIASSALGQVREHLADRGDPKWRDVAELQWGNFPMTREWWPLWHAAWQTETLMRRRTPDDEIRALLQTLLEDGAFVVFSLPRAPRRADAMRGIDLQTRGGEGALRLAGSCVVSGLKP